MLAKIPSFFYSVFDRCVGSLSIRYTLPLIIVTPLLASVTAIGWFSFQAGKHEIEKLVLEISEKSTQMIEYNLENYLETPRILLPAYLAALESGKVDFNNLSEVKQYFWQQIQQKNSLNSIYMGTQKGNYVAIYKTEKEFFEQVKDESTNGNRDYYELDSEGNRVKLIKSVTYDPRIRPWYKFAENAAKPVWTPVYQFATKNTVGMDFSIPIYNQQSRSLEGIISTELSLSQISNFLRNLEISANGKAMILERTGDVIATSTLDQPFKLVNDQLQRVNVVDSQDPIIRATGKYLIQNFKSLEKIKEKQQLTVQLSGGLQLIQITPLQDQHGLDWLMVVIIPYSDFFKHIYSYTSFTLIIGISVAGIAIFLALLLVHWIIKPIRQLQKCAKTLEKGSFNADLLKEVTTRRDEFGQLGKVFLAMANVIYSREKSWKQMIEQLQTEKLQQQKMKHINSSYKEVKDLEALLIESQQIRTKIDASPLNQREEKGLRARG